MPERITGKEIIRQSDQGLSVRPFIVRADDGLTYFVKGFNRAGGPSLISEVIAAEIGRHLGLPIPCWKIMHIPQALLDFSAMDNVQDLGGGPAFASLQVENASDLMWSHLESIPVELQRKVLMFDWLLLNGDRILGESGAGNVNLLIDSKGEMVVIDHNAAFERELTHHEMVEFHVFRAQIGFHRADMLARLEYMPLLDAAIADWDRITSLLPEQWIFRDADQIDETEPTLQERLQILERFRTEQFWGQL
ncbi:HipA family kinase [Stutzerimonas nitrititolerans]|uniref:HipA family kinase n=1 Tax=Stutzerimonas nitrititolerans TaxID=2482751 RepID=UPI002897E1A6|nr:HipA family kinase [Stutzerimonas nitrititolerans]